VFSLGRRAINQAMIHDVELGCSCGAVQGVARGISPLGVHRAVCYCDDCQAFMHYLGHAEWLDDHGGSDVVQLPPSMIQFERGMERIVSIRLTEKGLHRWFADCCKTPLGNTMTPAIPFIGIPVVAFKGVTGALQRDEAFGKPRAVVMGKFAIGEVPDAAPGFPFVAQVRALSYVLRWKLAGKSWPHPYYDRGTGAPKYPVKILTTSEREALRPLCGPGLLARPH
jgi:hypothetical protein